jgi:hypothetical protein
MNASHHTTCYWLTPTRLMPEPYRFAANTRPWSCVRDICPRPLSACELESCETCARWEQRTFDAVRRDLVVEAWGGVDVPPNAETFDDVRRDLVHEAWGVD